MKTKEIIEAFKQLSIEEQHQTLSSLELAWERQSGAIQQISAEIESSRSGNMSCVHCQSTRTIRRGMYKNTTKYSCNNCGKHFTSSYGTALYRIQRKDKWNEYLQLMEQGVSIKRSAKQLGISIQTSFDWRHKILAAMQGSLPKHLSGVVECDEMLIAESFKGEKKLSRIPRKRGSDAKKHDVSKVMLVTAVSRSGDGLATVVKGKKLNKKKAVKALEGKIEDQSILITDECSAYNAVAKKQPNIKHKTVNSLVNRTQKPKDKIHLQTVNQQHKQIREFLAKFNGVATKYLPNYLNWYYYKKMQKNNLAKINTALTICLTQVNIPQWQEKIQNLELIIRT